MKIWFFAMVFLFAAACSEASEAALSLELKTDKKTYVQGENVTLILRFTNHSNGPITLCRAMLPTYNLKLYIKCQMLDGSEREVVEQPTVYDFFLKKENYVTLGSQKIFELEMPLVDFFGTTYRDIFTTGKFAIKAEYSNWFSHYFEDGKEYKIATWTGKLVSNVTSVNFGRFAQQN